jgi:ADP-ribosylglycohydrolase
MFLGVAIGDALGMPVETFDANRIAKDYGLVDKYFTPDGHKWFDGEESGSITDDTQLTLAVAKGLIASEGKLRMKDQVETHVEAFKDSTAGWGKTTREAIRRLANGASHVHSGKLGFGGTGNGVPMKIAPLGVLAAGPGRNIADPKIVNFIVNMTQMTHRTSLSVSAALAQTFAVSYCLQAEEFDAGVFLDFILTMSEKGRHIFSDTLEDDLTDRLELLKDYQEYDAVKCIEDFGGGHCYVYHSLPFTYAFFMRNPHKIEALYDVVSAGGDTDTNGSMVGALLGALNGKDIFPEHLLTGLKPLQEVTSIANEFCDILGI